MIQHLQEEKKELEEVEARIQALKGVVLLDLEYVATSHAVYLRFGAFGGGMARGRGPEELGVTGATSTCSRGYYNKNDITRICFPS